MKVVMDTFMEKLSEDYRNNSLEKQSGLCFNVDYVELMNELSFSVIKFETQENEKKFYDDLFKKRDDLFKSIFKSWSENEIDGLKAELKVDKKADFLFLGAAEYLFEGVSPSARPHDIIGNKE